MTDVRKGGSGGLHLAIVAIALIVVIAIAIIGYAVVGYAAGETRVSEAEKTLNVVIADQNKFITTFKEIDTKFSGLNANTNFDAKQAKTLYAQFVADAQDSGSIVDRDQASMAAASLKLDEQAWLTAIDKGNINKTHTRLTHAQKALTSAKLMSDDYVLDGQFFQALVDTIIDLDTLSSQASASDLGGAKATVATLKTHVEVATQKSSAPGLPPEYHSLMVDFQALAADFGHLLDAITANDGGAVSTYVDRLNSDSGKISAYNFDKMVTDLSAFYKPYIDTFNSEMSAATT